jgi:hypothetical protein
LQSDYELSLALKEKGSEIQNKVRPRAASALDPLPEQTCGREKEAATTSEAYSELEVHDWVPSGIADLARSLHKIGSANLARPFPTEGYALRRSAILTSRVRKSALHRPQVERRLILLKPFALHGRQLSVAVGIPSASWMG